MACVLCVYVCFAVHVVLIIIVLLWLVAGGSCRVGFSGSCTHYTSSPWPSWSTVSAIMDHIHDRPALTWDQYLTSQLDIIICLCVEKEEEKER